MNDLERKKLFQSKGNEKALYEEICQKYRKSTDSLTQCDDSDMILNYDDRFLISIDLQFDTYLSYSIKSEKRVIETDDFIPIDSLNIVTNDLPKGL